MPAGWSERTSRSTAEALAAGRTDDVINVAGHRLGTREIEEAVQGHNAIAEVAVVGVAGVDGKRGAFEIDIDSVEAIGADDLRDGIDEGGDPLAVGEGEVLAAAAEDFFRGRGCVAIDIDVLNLRPELAVIYKRYGFVVTGEGPFKPTRALAPGVEVHAVHMTKWLGEGKRD